MSPDEISAFWRRYLSAAKVALYDARVAGRDRLTLDEKLRILAGVAGIEGWD